MGRFSNISGKDAVKVFEKLGWQKRGQVGSHVIMTKEGEKQNLSVPQHKELALGTLRKLIKYANITIDEFRKLL